jgi:hypothetical protein
MSIGRCVEKFMPEKKTLERVRRDRGAGKAASTQAGEFVREEMDHIREGKHGARSTKQAIAIGLSKARRLGVNLKPPAKGTTSTKTRKSAERAYARGHGAPARTKPSAKRSRSTMQALKREGKGAASRPALSSQASDAARRRPASSRSAAARQASATKGASVRSAAARKAARTRASHAHA